MMDYIMAVKYLTVWGGYVFYLLTSTWRKPEEKVDIKKSLIFFMLFFMFDLGLYTLIYDFAEMMKYFSELMK
jgi:hypothetical protein